MEKEYSFEMYGQSSIYSTKSYKNFGNNKVIYQTRKCKYIIDYSRITPVLYIDKYN